MARTYHILVVGNDGQAFGRCTEFGKVRFRFSYCAEDNLARELADSNKRFDGLLMNACSSGEDQTDLSASLRAMGFFLEESNNAGLSACRLEWDKQGTLHLKCCRHSIPARGQQAVPLVEAAPDGCVFEFHAPMTRTG